MFRLAHTVDVSGIAIMQASDNPMVLGLVTKWIDKEVDDVQFMANIEQLALRMPYLRMPSFDESKVMERNQGVVGGMAAE